MGCARASILGFSLLLPGAGRSVVSPVEAWGAPVARSAAQTQTEAEALLEKALELVSRARYPDAVRVYEQLAAEHGDTEAGKIGARRSLPNALLGVTVMVRNGPPENRIDVAIMGDGFSLKSQKSFDKLAQDIPPVFAKQRTFEEYYGYFNFHRVNVVSHEDGVDGFGREYDTMLDGKLRGSDQGHVATDPVLVRQVLGELPVQDGLAIVLVRRGDIGTGTPGVANIAGRNFNDAMQQWGRAFVGLGYEYAYEAYDHGRPLGLVNVTETEDPATVPWAHWIEASVRGVGVYEGANGQVRDAFKPTSGGCVMERGDFFCPPCREAVVLEIYGHVDPIDAAAPPALGAEDYQRLGGDGASSLEFSVTVMQPASHSLVVDWWLLSEDTLPADPTLPEDPTRPMDGFRDRRGRGRLAPVPIKPMESTRGKKGVHRFELKTKKLPPGSHYVLCRARDATKTRSVRYAWVLRDPYGLLESERVWRVDLPERD